MEVRPKTGSSMMTQEQSSLLSSQRNPLVSMLTERTELLNCTKHLQLGSNRSGISMRTLLTPEVLYWKFKATDALRVDLLLLGKSIMVRIKGGSLDTTKITEVTSKEKEKTVTLDSS
jgi:hypothetical protein